MGNVTWLPEKGSDEEPFAFDTGPGNVLLDAAARLASAGELDYDPQGTMAARGTVDPDLLSKLLSHPFLSQNPPRTTGREVFGPGQVELIADERSLRSGMDPEGWNDLLATLTEFTARSVSEAYRRWIVPKGVDEVVLTGGGARNPEMVRRLVAALHPIPVRTGSDALGMDPDAREAAAFAVLAWAHLRGVAGNVPSATGAVRSCVLGSLTPAPVREVEEVSRVVEGSSLP